MLPFDGADGYGPELAEQPEWLVEAFFIIKTVHQQAKVHSENERIKQLMALRPGLGRLPVV